MSVRLLKAVLVLFVALFCLVYATQNVVNLEAAYFFLSSVLTMDGHVAYPDAFGPAIRNPALIWTALTVIIALEYTAGLLAARGAWDLWKARQEPAAEFNSSKKYAVLGCGVAIVIWFGLFSTIGGAYFQMWQTELGVGVSQNSFQFVGMIGIVLLFVNMSDE